MDLSPGRVMLPQTAVAGESFCFRIASERFLWFWN
jgi:hypothetical protein